MIIAMKWHYHFDNCSPYLLRNEIFICDYLSNSCRFGQCFVNKFNTSWIFCCDLLINLFPYHLVYLANFFFHQFVCFCNFNYTINIQLSFFIDTGITNFMNSVHRILPTLKCTIMLISMKIRKNRGIIGRLLK